jgi:methylated-DNA-[protein]-cysteine S-methyltransferase
MGQTAHRYLIFETAGDFCGIRLERRGHQALPAADQKRGSGRTSSAAPCARPQTRHAHTGGGSAIAAVKRYSRTRRPIFRASSWTSVSRTHSSSASMRRRAGSNGPHDDLWRSGKGTRRRAGSCARCRPGHGQDRVALIIPCHRVLAAGGKLGGFSAPGGSGAEKRMLALEGVHLDPPPPAQQSFRF